MPAATLRTIALRQAMLVATIAALTGQALAESKGTPAPDISTPTSNPSVMPIRAITSVSGSVRASTTVSTPSRRARSSR